MLRARQGVRSYRFIAANGLRARAQARSAPAASGAAGAAPLLSFAARPTGARFASSGSAVGVASSSVNVPGLRTEETRSMIEQSVAETAQAFESAAAPDPGLAEAVASTLTDAQIAMTSQYLPYWVKPSYYLQEGMLAFSDLSGAPLWVSIVAMGVLARLVTYPAVLASMKMSENSRRVQPKLTAVRKQMLDDLRSESPMRRQRAMTSSADMQKVLADAGVKPMETIKLNMMYNAPTFSAGFFALRNMSMKREEPLWMTGGPSLEQWGIPLDWSNLASPDPTFILPTLAAAALIAQMEFLRSLQPQASIETTAAKATKWVPRIMALGMIPAGAFWFESSISLFWIVNSASMFAMSMALRTPFGRRFSGLEEKAPEITVEQLDADARIAIMMEAPEVKARLAKQRAQLLADMKAQYKSNKGN